MTWNELARFYPELIQWAVQHYGPLPEGEVKEDDYNSIVSEFNERFI